MARLMGAFDWSRHPLGGPAHWPESLSTAVRIMLTSRFAMWMGWGDDLTFLYNDAYAAMTLGAKHPWALGRPAREVWAEIWPQLAPRIESVRRTGTATWDERLLLFLERSGFAEETYHTFSYSPLGDGAGTDGGMLCVVSEETERVIGERRLALLHQLGAELSGANTTAKVLAALARSLSKPAPDLPFTLTYSLDIDAGRMRCIAATGISPEHAAAADGVGAGFEHPVWPFASILGEAGSSVVALPPQLDWPRGAWDRAPSKAASLPLPSQGIGGPAGVFVAGLNPFRPFDGAYGNFIALFASQLSAALANARMYEAERQRSEALAELDRAKTAFFSNVSHEFRTPLTLMLAPTEDAVTTGRALGGEELRTVHHNQMRLLRLVNTLLEFSRIEAGRARAAYKAVDIAALTADLASTFRSAIERAGLGFEVSCPPIAAPVFIDPQMWERILLNLLSNAFKFTFEGTISVRLSEAAGHALLCVEDTGIGIGEHELPRVFDRFHRIEGTRARTHEGSGIGLALVQDLVKLHGGQISVTSQVGTGTRFSVSIPTGSDHLPADRLREGPRDEVGNSYASAVVNEALRWLPDELPTSTDEPVPSRLLRAGRVLIADDNADMRGYLARILGQQWAVEAVADGAAALAAARERRPDLIVSDVMMPIVDGFGLLRELRADPGLRGVPVIMLSARAGEEARIEGVEAGADDYLVKPFAARELLARVAARIELSRLRQRLANERAAIAHMFDQTPMPIAILRGRELTFEVANTQYVQAMGGRPLVGKTLLEAIPELVGQGFEALLHGVMDTGDAYVGHERPIQILRRGALEDTFWTFIYSPARGDDGRIDSVVAIGNDVTEQVVARKRLETLAHEAAQASRTKDEFLAMLGHELRNPLAPMRTALDLLRLRGTTSREQDVLERQVAHLSRLVDDLLDVARITRGKIDLDRRPHELSEVVLRAMEIASPVLEQAHHEVVIRVPRAGLGLNVDIERMAQVISNLLTNAAKYSDARSRIDVMGELMGDQVLLRIKDQGIGIAPEMIGVVFDAFVQLPQTIDRSRGGLGLGLAIVRSIVEKHGGKVSVESGGLGRGSDFVVALPWMPLLVAPAPGEQPASSPSEAPRAASKLILIVDDNEDAAEMLQEALSSLGHRVQVAHDGPSALAACTQFVPDVALLDIGLPVMDGFELAERLHHLLVDSGRAPGLRLVAVTGYGQDRDRDRSKRAGFHHHLVKPINLKELARTIDESG